MKTASKPSGQVFTATKLNHDQTARIAAQSRRISAFLRARGNPANMTAQDGALFGTATPAQLCAAFNGAVIG